MLEQGKARGNSGEGSFRFRGANRSVHLGYGSERFNEPSGLRVPCDGSFRIAEGLVLKLKWTRGYFL